MAEHIIIRDLAGLVKLREYLKDFEYIAYDTETTGLSRGSEIIGFSVCADPEVAYYVVLSYWDTAKQALVRLPTFEKASEFVEDLVGKKLIMHNGVFDCMITHAFLGVSLIDSLHTDSMILAHLLNENRPVGLKDLGVAIFGEDAKKEQVEMKASIVANGGSCTKETYELYKADSELIAQYGAKDAVLTLNLFYMLVEDLYEQKLDQFFYEDESMPLLRGPTYELNTTGMKVDPVKLAELKSQLEGDCSEAEAFILTEIAPHVAEKYPGTSKAKRFNINASQQLSWLLFEQLGNHFHGLTKGGKELCKALELRMPYTYTAKVEFIHAVKSMKGRVWEEAKFNKKTGKMGKPKKVKDYWAYTACAKDTLAMFSDKYKWVAKLREYRKNTKLLETYVGGIQSRMQYGIIRPGFMQHGTTSGRYSSSKPNFQNLPRDDKRVKACLVARPGKSLVGADQEQLEPRVFASQSGDVRLQKCFADGDDFYSVIGVNTFKVGHGLSLVKDAPGSFSLVFKPQRQTSKVVGLSATYGTTAFKMAPMIGKSIDEAQQVIDDYFEAHPDVHKFMLESHEQAKTHGVVYSLFGRPRRMPQAMEIPRIYGKKTAHAQLPYTARNILNLAVNHRVQSTGASIMNRASILFYRLCKEMALEDPRWHEVKTVLQVHDELVAEAPDAIAEDVAVVLKYAMENAVTLPGVALKAEPKIAKNLSGLK